MIGRSLESLDAQSVEATVTEAPLRFEDSFGAEHARLFGASDVLWEVPLLTCGRSSRSAGNRVVREF
jgi:hypothetical protein